MWRLIALTLLLQVTTAWAQTPDAASDDFFEKQIRPVLAARCWDCHGPDQQESDLRLDSREALLDGGSRGAVVVPGMPEKSLLITVINHADTLAMPPKEKMPLKEIVAITQWVKAGAVWPNSQATTVNKKPQNKGSAFSEEQLKHWAFQPIARPQPPSVRSQDWVKSPIDQFILAKLEENSLQPAPRADKRALIRRATFDLTGLPPTYDEVTAFVADDSPDAFARLIDRLLDSPAYGERWGRHWLDVARYGDSNGLDENLSQANAFRYRDYVVDALNADLPFDTFIHEQLAGDLLGGDDARATQRLTATGFLVIGAKMLAEDDPLKMQMDIIDEQVDTLSKAFMGMTLGCARCHDHKFDPISIKDYYSLAGIFKSTKTMENFSVVARWQERPLASSEELKQRDTAQAKVNEQQAEINRISQAATDELVQAARNRVDEYVLAAAEQLWLSLKAKSFGARLDAKPPQALPEGAVLIEAENYQRGNVLKSKTGYGEGIGVILNAGKLPNIAEYDIDLPAAGWYQFETRYAAASARPVQLTINGEVVSSKVSDGVTGSWNPDTQRWEVEGQFQFRAGQNVVRLFAAHPFPHIDKFLLVKRTVSTRTAETAVTGDQTKSNQTALLKQFVDQWAEYLRKDAASDSSMWPEWRTQLNALKDSGEDGVASADFFAAASKIGEALRATDAEWKAIKASNRSVKTLPDATQESRRQLLYMAKPESPFHTKGIEDQFDATTKTTLLQKRDELKTLEAAVPKFPEVMAVSDSKPEDLPVHLRGNHTTLAKDLEPRRFPQIMQLNREPLAKDVSGRLELARWLTNPSHPLTRRVIVNRVWLWHFGEGLVRSPDNFGLLGERPTHPELLDWLAQRFMSSGWSLKQLHRELMLSATYQMSSQFDARANELDPDHRLWWRRPIKRLEVEAVRDAVLAVSGSLDQRLGGSLLPTPNRNYVTSTANVNPAIYDAPRRAIYLPVVRSALYDLYQAFDFAEPTVLNGRREVTTIPTQALFMLNSKLVSQQSRALALSLLNDEATAPNRVREAYRRILQREASAAEVARAEEFLKQLENTSETTVKNSQEREIRCWQSLIRTLISTNEFIYLN